MELGSQTTFRDISGPRGNPKYLEFLVEADCAPLTRVVKSPIIDHKARCKFLPEQLGAFDRDNYCQTSLNSLRCTSLCVNSLDIDYVNWISQSFTPY